MIKKRSILLFAIIPLIAGYVIASDHTGKISTIPSVNTQFNTNHIPNSDKLLISVNGDLYLLSTNSVSRITTSKNYSEPQFLKTHILTVDKKENSSAIIQIDYSGNADNTIQNGTTHDIDKMSWYTDPSVNSTNDELLFVSDKNRFITNIPDNALFEEHISTGIVTTLVNPDHYSGGIAHPLWDPVNSHIIVYDDYHYDPITLVPYSRIDDFNLSNLSHVSLTSQKLNAYQASISPDGKQILFLSRNADLSSVSLYIADFSPDGLTNINKIATGLFAYPMFSYTPHVIYFYNSTLNSPYSFFQASISQHSVINIIPLISGNGISATSAYAIQQIIHPL